MACAWLLAAVAGLASAGAADARPPCTAAPSSAGEWPSYGHDLANTRDQADEHTIGTGNVAGLKPAWVFSSASAGDTSSFQTAPVVGGGCVFIGSTAGTVYALDANTGQPVWKRQLDVPAPALGGAIVGAGALTGNAVIELANQTGGPYAVALDRSTGAVLWRSAPIVTTPGDYTNASPVVANGLVAVGFSAPEGDSTGQGGFALLSAATGQVVKVTPTVPPADQAKGYAGGGLWSTPAYDPATHFLYWGAGNPFSKTQEHPNTDAILKIDLGRSSPTFGQIVAAYNGNVDQYSGTLQTLSHTPVCSASDSPSVPDPLDDPACGQLDLDFGASPNLFRDASGNELVGELQKSGVYHVAHAGSMTPAWTQLVGVSCQACNAGSTAFDGNSILGVGAPGGEMFSLDRSTGSVNWASPVGDGVHYQGASVANGVTYTVDGDGFLDANDATSGAVLLHRQTSVDAGTLTGDGAASNGVAIAEGSVFAALTSAGSSLAETTGSNAGSQAGSYVIAYRLPG